MHTTKSFTTLILRSLAAAVIVLLLAPTLSAQAPATWSSTSPTTLPAPGKTHQAEMIFRAPTSGIDSISLSTRITLTGGTVYAYAYGRTSRNDYLAYQETARVKTDSDTTFTLTIGGLAAVEMDSVVFGLYHYGKGTLRAEPPLINRSAVPVATPKPEITAYLDSFFTIVRLRALDRDLLDWKQLRSDAYALSAPADSLADVHDVLEFTLRRIDHHSYLQKPDHYAGWQKGNNDNDEVDPNLKYPTGRRVDERMVYLNMPGVSSGHQKTLLAYADSLQRLITRLDADGTDEWMVDLRSNTGGNCWAMLAGVGPLLGDGICGYFMQRDGSQATSWWYWEGASYSGRNKQVSPTAPHTLRDTTIRIAVLHGERTASSGEVMAIAFRGLDNARSFGQPTSGYSTGNRIYRLADGAAVVLTVSVYGDRNKQAFGEAVTPDEVVESIRGTDAAAERAADWLRAGRKF